MKTTLPVNLHLDGRRCVIVGGGEVATRRMTAFLQTGATMVAIAPQMHSDMIKLETDHDHLTLIHRAYESGDLDDAMLVVIATDNPAVNDQVTEDARAAHVLINRSDQPVDGDLTIPAHAHHGPITLAVHTHGISAGASASIRRELSAALDPNWAKLLATLAPFRAVIIGRFDDPHVRSDLLRRISGDEAMSALKSGGENAVTELIQHMIRDAENAPPTHPPHPSPPSPINNPMPHTHSPIPLHTPHPGP